MGGSIEFFPKRVPRSNSSLLRAHSRGSFSRLVGESEAGNGEYATSFMFFMCQIMVICFRLVTPASYLGLLAFIFLPVKPDMLWGPYDGVLMYWFLLAFMAVESLFFPYYLYIFTMSNERNVELHHFAKCPNSRMKLIQNCFNAMTSAGAEGSLMDRSPEIYLRKVLEGWHLDEPIGQIYRENFAQWAAWAFWNKDLIELFNSERKELENVVNFVEEKVNWKFQEGFNKSTRSARLNLDPIFATQRPFFFYASIWIMNTLCHVILYCLGWRVERDQCARGQTIYRRKGTGRRAGAEGERRLPVFFIHGLGIGFTHYLNLLVNLPTDVDVYLLEWPHVSMQLTTKVPKMEDTTRIINSALDAHGHEAACFLAHSLGTTALSWMLHHEERRSKVAATVMLDPVVFLLCDPTVATNFVYKPPRNTIDFLMHFFISRELFISRALSRHFNWSHNIMFVEDLFVGHDSGHASPRRRFKEGTGQDEGHGTWRTKESIAHNSLQSQSGSGDSEDLQVGMGVDTETTDSAGATHMAGNWTSSSSPASRRRVVNHTIVLSSDDGIVPVGPVSRYLHAKNQERSASSRPNFEVTMFHGQHGEMMIYPSWARKIAAYVDEKL